MKSVKLTKVLAVTTNFPSPRFPEKGVFVKNILLEMARQNAEVDVISPISWVSAIKTLSRERKPIDYGLLNVCQPTITTLSLRSRGWLRKLFVKFNDYSFMRAVDSSVKKDTRYDLCYCHFYRSGKALLNIMEKNNVPVILNLGESNLGIYDSFYGKNIWINDLKRFTAIITVSKKNRDFLIKRQPLLESKIHYIPNGVDTNRFMPIERKECRERLGLPLNIKIVIFVGHFIERKGVHTLLKAIKQLGIQGVFLGCGPIQPIGKEVLFSGAVINDDLPYWLNAADVFVLPSSAEGMSNAILEALACGLPLVVSDLDFNHEFLTSECAEFIDRDDSGSIAKGIMRTFEKGRSDDMKDASLSLVQQYKIENRINKIFSLVQKVVNAN
ncbi:MAG: teichuronic acid biosynthesis glycosyltransferase TuaC [Oleiphilaceae bacterium]|jgi:glycosyltransferase involved in cell wall biosynthesis